MWYFRSTCFHSNMHKLQYIFTAVVRAILKFLNRILFLTDHFKEKLVSNLYFSQNVLFSHSPCFLNWCLFNYIVRSGKEPGLMLHDCLVMCSSRKAVPWAVLGSLPRCGCLLQAAVGSSGEGWVSNSFHCWEMTAVEALHWLGPGSLVLKGRE